ncbi:hypothetical protein RBB79_18735 [Tunturiibacter empetritectus]|uniref:Uncharacterized protein n=1 Tax=Tunturiibacter lichenicola TaxID=2051959 RepID=A0A852VJ95_9BACT|nr:hypothetical protein [Edaphobacter lichenicola]NYF91700.1 hypothetical protein [Edaphobacter lichenicola]
MLWLLVVLDNVFENFDVVLELSLILVETGERIGQALSVAFDLGVEAGFGFVDEMTVVLPLDAAFEAERDEQADGDGQEMKQKVSPAMNGFMGRVHIDHGGDLVEIH